MGSNDNLYNEGNISKMPDFEVVGLLHFFNTLKQDLSGAKANVY